MPTNPGECPLIAGRLVSADSKFFQISPNPALSRRVFPFRGGHEHPGFLVEIEVVAAKDNKWG
jgi:hypothetical protein